LGSGLGRATPLFPDNRNVVIQHNTPLRILDFGRSLLDLVDVMVGSLKYPRLRYGRAQTKLDTLAEQCSAHKIQADSNSNADQYVQQVNGGESPSRRRTASHLRDRMFACLAMDKIKMLVT
jgi:hypothetical protein